MSTKSRTPGLLRLVVVGCLAIALSQTQALAQGGGGTPDPSDTPVMLGLARQITVIDWHLQRLAAIGGGSPDPSGLPRLVTLASRLTEVDLHLGLATVGGGTPDPGETALISSLVQVRNISKTLAERLEPMFAAAQTDPILTQVTITRTLRFMLTTAEMIVARVDFTLRHLLPTPVPDF